MRAFFSCASCTDTLGQLSSVLSDLRSMMERQFSARLVHDLMHKVMKSNVPFVQQNSHDINSAAAQQLSQAGQPAAWAQDEETAREHMHVQHGKLLIALKESWNALSWKDLCALSCHACVMAPQGADGAAPP